MKHINGSRGEMLDVLLENLNPYYNAFQKGIVSTIYTMNKSKL